MRSESSNSSDNSHPSSHPLIAMNKYYLSLTFLKTFPIKLSFHFLTSTADTQCPNVPLCVCRCHFFICSNFAAPQGIAQRNLLKSRGSFRDPNALHFL